MATTGKSSYTPDNNTEKQVAQQVTSQMETILNGMINNLKKQLNNLTDKTSESAEKIYEYIDNLEEDLADHRIDLFNESDAVRLKASKIYYAYENKLLGESNAQQRAAIYKNQAEEIKSFRKRYEQKQATALTYAKKEAQLLARIENEKDEAKKEELTTQLISAQKGQTKAESFLESHKTAYSNSGKKLIDAQMSAADFASKSGNADAALAAIKAAKEAVKTLGADTKENKKNLEILNKQETKALVDKQKEESKDRKDKAREDSLARKAELKYRLTTLDGIANTLEQGMNKLFDSIEKPIKDFYQYQAKYEARMQGSDNHYNKMLQNIARQVGMSPFMKQETMVKNLQTLIDTGTNYNLELRAYIATVSENIASTFDAFDSELLRLIRIQQNDSTAARLGMESRLTQLFNKMYSDSSYLKDASDSVTHALLDASAQLPHTMAAEFEFVAQKWLGSLYSLGVSSSTVETIAKTIGYIGSGNIEALNGSEQMMTLLSMSAAKGGTSISDLLTGDLTAKKTNDLLYGMTQLLSDIADNTESNKVTKSAFANVFGITNTDLKSISNLSEADISYLYSQSDFNYNAALNEASQQVTKIGSRTHISQMIDNVVENAINSSALTIGGNPAIYALYKATSLISNLVGDRGIEIPGIQAMGTGTASGISIIPIMKAAITGFGLLGSIIGSIGNLGSGGLPALDRWAGYEKGLSRGNALELNLPGVQSGFSESAQYNNTSNQSSGDMTKSAMQSSKDSAVENQSEEDRKAQEDAEKYQDNVITHLENIEAALIGEQKLKVEVVNTSVPVNLSSGNSESTNSALKIDFSSEAEATLKKMLTLMLASELADDGLSTGEGSALTFTDIINDALKNLHVTIDNDFFDEWLQKESQKGVG